MPYISNNLTILWAYTDWQWGLPGDSCGVVNNIDAGVVCSATWLGDLKAAEIVERLGIL
ncbi:hypothetical protein [Sulfobacillus thermosulfidooxidans]|uniref:hypothetical protein n=1 Tax=Sulfobacillus thermosulfidooxidans TaxID=28034 RepID=UPI000B07C0DF|nr:hypothetical protein [Sulfobacillus thermosulfidooxidans]